ncbi:MAG: precorrin-3B C(17)-methyltransferase [Deltaproteobacteria bacterium]|nr:precorrin-3B C(17)-methyltransferase [Deltaproteobacteria bacterium]
MRRGPYRLPIVGLGSSGPDGLTGAAKKALAEASVVLGYKLYLEEARPFVREGASLEGTPMTAEMARAEKALDLAGQNVSVAMVSGGDPGVYAMAGAVFEVAAARGLPLGPESGQYEISVITGTPAVTAAAALLGAPLTHDFCAISLSDRLTEWPTIEKRLDLASQAGFVMAIYNPKSRGRDWQLGRAVEILLKNLSPQTPVGLASRLGRAGQSTTLTTLEDLPKANVDMQTTVIVGNRTTFVYQGRMITPRGYLGKYGPPS